MSFMIKMLIAYGQDSSIARLDISNFSDCVSAMSISTSNIVGPTTSPHGYGKIIEFKDNPVGSLYFFEKEHHTVWYKFRALQTAWLVFDIFPLQPADDYDFLLFKAGDNFCNDIFQKKAVPVRTNIARTGGQNAGKTGLSLQASQEFVRAGPGDSYSKALKVNKGDLFYLVLDNVYEKGEGHYIIFDYLDDRGKSLSPKSIRGKVMDLETRQPLQAEITFYDISGAQKISSATADISNGEFSILLPADIQYFETYKLSVSRQGYFFKDIEVVPYQLINKREKTEIFLAKLRENKSYQITNIYFYPNSPQYISASEPVLNDLLKLMNENQGMKIEIQGHIDGCAGNDYIITKLSESRALNIKKYLVDRGISPDRIIAKGYGCQKMIYPNPENEEERQMNRRVEIIILKM
ncbi:MAG: OmpA family protein [Sphingobacteriales bacterium]|nr:OmpA family protein [Sphingobacteriales bacterium]